MRIVLLTWFMLTGVPALSQFYAYRNDDGKLVITDRPVKKQGLKLVDTYIPKRMQERAKTVQRSRSARGKYVLNDEQIHGLVYPIAKSMGVDPNLVKAVITVESHGDARAKSHKGAMGLMQLIPATAERFGVDNPWDPRQNVKGGVRYLQYLLSYFEGDVDLVLAAYNAGENAVDRHRGVPPYSETRHYLRKVRRLYSTKQLPYRNVARSRSVLVGSRTPTQDAVEKIARAE